MGGVDPGPETRVKVAASVMWDKNNLTVSVVVPLHGQLSQDTQGNRKTCVFHSRTNGVFMLKFLAGTTVVGHGDDEEYRGTVDSFLE